MNNTEIMQSAIQNPAIHSKRKRKKYDMVLLYMALPLILLTFIFYYLPLYGWIFAFFDYQPGVPLYQQTFTGMKYFVQLFANGNEFVNALKNTLVFSFMNILFSPLPVVLAIMLAEVKSKKISRILQTITSIPNFISWALVFSVFFVFFSHEGLLNEILLSLGWIKQPINVLGNENLVWTFQPLVALWKGAGWSAIIYIAAIAGIDQELYSAAEIDGAGRFARIWYITVPGVMPTYVVLLLLTIGSMLNSGFEQYFVFQNPLIFDKIEVLDTYTYRVGLGNAQFAFATAVGMFKSIVGVTLLFTVNWISRRVRNESIV